ncbi:MAG: stage II sporulation protein M, partial [Granulosicoccaceae bacterium]
LSEAGAAHAFWGFVAGHSAPELLGAAVAGTGGLLMGKALLKPEDKTRWNSLLAVAPDALRLVAGAALLTF